MYLATTIGSSSGTCATQGSWSTCTAYCVDVQYCTVQLHLHNTGGSWSACTRTPCVGVQYSGSCTSQGGHGVHVPALHTVCVDGHGQQQQEHLQSVIEELPKRERTRMMMFLAEVFKHKIRKEKFDTLYHHWKPLSPEDPIVGTGDGI